MNSYLLGLFLVVCVAQIANSQPFGMGGFGGMGGMMGGMFPGGMPGMPGGFGMPVPMMAAGNGLGAGSLPFQSAVIPGSVNAPPFFGGAVPGGSPMPAMTGFGAFPLFAPVRTVQRPEPCVRYYENPVPGNIRFQAGRFYPDCVNSQIIESMGYVIDEFGTQVYFQNPQPRFPNNNRNSRNNY